MDLHSFKDIIFFQDLVFILKQQSPSKRNTDLKLRWPVVGRYQLTKALGTLPLLSTKNALIPSLQSLPRWKETQQKTLYKVFAPDISREYDNLALIKTAGRP